MSSAAGPAERPYWCRRVIYWTGGSQSREVMDLLMALQEQAPQQGGRVVVLLGNHEMMNLIGDLRYVTPESYLSFSDDQSEQRRQEGYRTYRKLHKRNQQYLGAPKNEEEWRQAHPPGFFRYREAFEPSGHYGRWLRQLPVMVEIDGTLFLHAGLDPKFSIQSMQGINERIQLEIETVDRHREHMAEEDLAAPFFDLQELATATRVELEKLKARARRVGQGRTKKITDLEELLNSENWFSIQPDGPLWSRGFAQWPDEKGKHRVSKLLLVYGADRFVVGHTPQLPGQIHQRFDGKVFLIDTGMLSSYYKGGLASALEIKNSIFTAVYLGGKNVLYDPKASVSPAPPEGVEPLHNTTTGSGPVNPAKEGNTFFFQTRDQATGFLRQARIVSSKRLGEGSTVPLKLLLEQDGVQKHAIFRDVDREQTQMRMDDGRTALFFTDKAIYEMAAYELSELLEFKMVPPTVERTVDRKKGTVQFWMDDTLTEMKRVNGEIPPPAAGLKKWSWMMRWQMLFLFDNLVYNDDRNRGNILFDNDWKMFLIDHTRAFRRWKELPSPNTVRFCERSVWERLQSVEDGVLKQRLGPFLSPPEMVGLLARRRALVKHIRGLIDQHGQSDVLFTLK